MERVLQTASRKHVNMANYSDLIRNMRNELAKRDVGDFVGTLVKAVEKRPSVECIYVLDETGRQVTDMIFATKKSGRGSAMFRPLPILADHSLRDYFYFLNDAGFSRSTYTTTPYVSMVTGNLCVTIAAKIKDVNQRDHFLCMDVHTL
jgi:hypothetical protein